MELRKYRQHLVEYYTRLLEIRRLSWQEKEVELAAIRARAAGVLKAPEYEVRGDRFWG
jgi:hypothetical protein